MSRATTEICRVAWCGRPYNCRGYCVMHRNRLHRSGDRLRIGGPGPQIAARGSGHVDHKGYRILCLPGHPLARSQGKVYEHRVVLHAAIGPGAHACHWCGRVVTWDADEQGDRLMADHLDDDKLNNAPENLVPACLDCNTARGRS